MKRLAAAIIGAEVVFAASFVYAGVTNMHGTVVASPGIYTFDERNTVFDRRLPVSAESWIPINDYLGDQRYDGIPGTENYSYWGEIGRVEDDGPCETCWSWTIIRVDNYGEGTEK